MPRSRRCLAVRLMACSTVGSTVRSTACRGIGWSRPHALMACAEMGNPWPCAGSTHPSIGGGIGMHAAPVSHACSHHQAPARHHQTHPAASSRTPNSCETGPRSCLHGGIALAFKKHRGRPRKAAPASAVPSERPVAALQEPQHLSQSVSCAGVEHGRVAGRGGGQRSGAAGASQAGSQPSGRQQCGPNTLLLLASQPALGPALHCPAEANMHCGGDCRCRLASWLPDWPADWQASTVCRACMQAGNMMLACAVRAHRQLTWQGQHLCPGGSPHVPTVNAHCKVDGPLRQ